MTIDERVFGVNGQMTGLYLGSTKSGAAAKKEFQIQRELDLNEAVVGTSDKYKSYKNRILENKTTNFQMSGKMIQRLSKYDLQTMEQADKLNRNSRLLLPDITKGDNHYLQSHRQLQKRDR